MASSSRVPSLLQLPSASSGERVAAFVRGVCVNGCLVALLVLVRFGAPAPVNLRSYDRILIAPATPVALAPVKPRIVAPRFRPESLTYKTPALTAPAILPPAPVLQVEITPATAIPQAAQLPSMPKPQPVVGTFQQAEAVASLKPTAEPTTVVTGGFSASTSANAVHIPAGPAVQMGSFSEAGAGVGERRAASGQAFADAGFGRSGGGAARSKSGSASVVTAGFDAQAAPVAMRKAALVSERPAVKAVQILSKPKPEYSEEARRLKIEGEVWLEILFGSDGRARVLRVVRPLGHGLDETATRAAAQIRFVAAEQDGAPVDQSAVVRVQFQLAN